MKGWKITPRPWWDESGCAHAKAPTWTPTMHACVHPIANQNGQPDDCAWACHCVNVHGVLVAALKSAEKAIIAARGRDIAYGGQTYVQGLDSLEALRKVQAALRKEQKEAAA